MKWSVFSEGTRIHTNHHHLHFSYFREVFFFLTTPPYFTALVHSCRIFLPSQDQPEPTATEHINLSSHLFSSGKTDEFSLHFSHQTQKPFSSRLSQVLGGIFQAAVRKLCVELMGDSLKQMRPCWRPGNERANEGGFTWKCSLHILITTRLLGTLTFFFFSTKCPYSVCFFFISVYKRKQMYRKFPL